jgi:hypothetical protein
MRPTYEAPSRQVAPIKKKNMATPIRWNQRRRVVPYSSSNRPDTPLKSLAVSLTHVARAALTEPYMLSIEHERIH